MALGGLQESCISPTNDKRPTSKEGSRPDSQPKSPTAMEPAKREVEQPGCDPREPGFSQRSHVPASPAHDEQTVLDWPLSALAGRCIGNPHSTPELHVPPRTPIARLEPHGPPTPVPPLHWQGYQNYHRPTYATWHSQVQESRDQQAQNLCSHGLEHEQQ
ncbi:unnamed protein product [Candidula unifasciata]|uniref:Uncharacterized protein n=1 Tax=Candidula unifasciata TaxID=100452 RepID=A0A8S3ZCV4_9EUPU|nr:unnamed protein product [Candidula unifasciata]